MRRCGGTSRRRRAATGVCGATATVPPTGPPRRVGRAPAALQPLILPPPPPPTTIRGAHGGAGEANTRPSCDTRGGTGAPASHSHHPPLKRCQAPAPSVTARNASPPANAPRYRLASAALPFVGPRRARFIYPSHGALSRGVPGCDAPPPPPVGLCRSFRRAPIAAVSARRPSLKAIRCSPSCRRLVRLHLHGGARWLLADARTSLLVDPVLCRCRAV